VKEGFAGLKTLCQRCAVTARAGVFSTAGMYLELRPGPMCWEHARPQPPAGRRRYGGGAEEPAPVPVGVTGHRTQRPRGQVGPPGPHPTQPSSSLDPGGERGAIIRHLAPLIAQLVLSQLQRGAGRAPSSPSPSHRGIAVCGTWYWPYRWRLLPPLSKKQVICCWSPVLPLSFVCPFVPAGLAGRWCRWLVAGDWLVALALVAGGCWLLLAGNVM
jgi:hypothetical protein